MRTAPLARNMVSTNKCRQSQGAYAKVNDDYLKISRTKAFIVHVYHRRYQFLIHQTPPTPTLFQS